MLRLKTEETSEGFIEFLPNFAKIGPHEICLSKNYNISSQGMFLMC